MWALKLPNQLHNTNNLNYFSYPERNKFSETESVEQNIIYFMT